MLLIYVPKLTNRLGYTINVVMRDILRTEFTITTDIERFESYDGPRLCYGFEHLGGAATPFFKSVQLLFDTFIENQDCHYFELDGTPALYPVFGRDVALPFDAFAAIFFMLSRYEEYLPHRKDEHGRYQASESIAYKCGFLQKPVVDQWALMIKDALLQFYPDLTFKKRTFVFQQTVDIDAAYCYRNKGFLRSCMCFLRDFAVRDIDSVRHRWNAIKGKEVDPFDTFDYIIEQNEKYKLRKQLLFFVLLSDYDEFDKPSPFYNSNFRALIRHIGDYAKVGIHGSYFSSDDADKMDVERRRLTDILRRTIVRNRFHFLRFSLPQSFRNLERIGIRHDYSMGYADVPGFRNGTCSIVPIFDISQNQELDVRLHPFVAMDTTFHTHMGVSPEEAIRQYHQLIDNVFEVNGTFSCIFHNQNLCEAFGWEGWRDVYEDVLRYAASKMALNKE